MKIFHQSLILIIYLQSHLINAFFESLKDTFSYYIGDEYCDSNWIMFNYEAFQKDLKSELFGQPIVLQSVGHAVQSHFKKGSKSRKALALSFHGWQGNGKNFVAEFIAKNFFKKGLNSKFFHFFNGRVMFPLERSVHMYRVELASTIRNALNQCPKSIFVFDEVDKIPVGVLDILKPFLDFRQHKVDARQAIFIFLSNAGSQAILEKYLEFWREGRSRDSLTLNDFDSTIQSSVFNEQGGLFRSDTIQSSLIDHFIPFLPLEKSHVNKCIVRDLLERVNLSDLREDSQKTQDMVDEIFKTITFGPEPENLFSLSGCKRITQQVATIVEKALWDENWGHTDL